MSSGIPEAEAAAALLPTGVFSLGCQFASLVIDNFLAGVLFMQAVQYFTYQGGDKWTTKGVVIWTCIMNALVTIYYWIYLQYLFVQNYGLWAPWLETRWLADMPVFDVMTVSVVQVFFAHRAFLLTKRNWPLFISILLMIGLAFSGGIAVKVVFGGLKSELEAAACATEIYIWLSATSAADILITVSIMAALLRSKSGWEHTDKTITRLIRLTAESQLLPTFLAIAYIVEYVQVPSSLLGAVFQSIQSKAYAVGLLFSLNARISFTQSTNTALTQNHQVFGMNTLKGRATEIQVEVETETYVHNDKEPKKPIETDSLSDLNGKSYNHIDMNGGYPSTTRLTGPELV